MFCSANTEQQLAVRVSQMEQIWQKREVGISDGRLNSMKANSAGCPRYPQNTVLNCIKDAERRQFPRGTMAWNGSGGSCQLPGSDAVQTLCSAS